MGTRVSNCYGFDIPAIGWAKADGSGRDWVVMLELLCPLKTCWISPNLVEISPKSQSIHKLVAEHSEEQWRSVKVEGICQSDQARQILRRKPATIRF